MFYRNALIIIGLLQSCVVAAQTNSTFAPLGAKWYYDSMSDGAAPFSSEYYLYQSIKDTSVSGQACRKLLITYYNYHNTIDTLTPLYVYGDTNKVYYFNNVFRKFCLLYDFNVNKNDTVTLYEPDTSFQQWKNDSTFRLRVDSVYYSEIDGKREKFIHTVPIDDRSFWNSYVTDVGCLNLMLPQPSAIFPEWDGPLRCYQDSFIYFNYKGIACDYRLTNGINYLSGNNFVKVYPSVTSDQFNIEIADSYHNKAIEWSMMNMYGELILSKQKLYKELNSISVSNLPAGVYFIQIEEGKHLLYRDKIVILHP